MQAVGTQDDTEGNPDAVMLIPSEVTELDMKIVNFLEDINSPMPFSCLIDEYEQFYISTLPDNLNIEQASVISNTLNINVTKASPTQPRNEMRFTALVQAQTRTTHTHPGELKRLSTVLEESAQPIPVIRFRIPRIYNLPESTSWYLVFGNLFVTTLSWFRNDVRNYVTDSVTMDSNHFCFIASAELLRDIRCGAIYLTRAKMQRLYDMFHSQMIPPVISAHVVRDCSRGCMREQLNRLSMNSECKQLRHQVSEALDKCSYFQSIEPALKKKIEIDPDVSFYSGTASQSFMDVITARQAVLHGQHFVDSDFCLCDKHTLESH